jgi:hypothetical protein
MMQRHLMVEAPDSVALVDFLGQYPFSVRLELEDGKLWIQVISAIQEAKILVDEVVEVPEGDEEDHCEKCFRAIDIMRRVEEDLKVRKPILNEFREIVIFTGSGRPIILRGE